MTFEISILDFIQSALQCSFLDICVPIISSLGNGGIVWIIFALLLLASKKTRSYGIYMSLSLIIMLVVCNITIKPLVARTRPFDYNKAVKLLIAPPQDYSFPSGHTTAAFSSATAYYMCYLKRKSIKEKSFFDKKSIVVFMFIFAVIIAFTRLYLYVHYPTDVLFGALLGILIGFISAKIINLKTKHTL